MIRHALYIILLYSIILLACGGRATSSPASVLQPAQIPTQAPTPKPKHYSPCQLLFAKEVRLMFSIPEGVDLAMRSDYDTDPTCVYEWSDRRIKKPGEVVVVMFDNADPSMYENAIKIYGDAEAIENVGEMASWGAQMARLTFLSKEHLFHIHVNVSDDQTINRTKAIEASRILIQRI